MILVIGAILLGCQLAQPSLDPCYTRRSVVADTIDVGVGSPLIDGARMRSFTTRIRTFRVAGADPALVSEATNVITLGDSAGVPVVRVRSSGWSMGPKGRIESTTDFTFDRATLALRGMVSRAADGSERALHADGRSVEMVVPLPNGAPPLRTALATPGFYGPWSDFVVEELPRRVGTVYRVHLWRPAPQPGGPPRIVEETHLYTVARREDVAVLGKTYRQAWVIEDRLAGNDALAGTMWIVDGPPNLVRWLIAMPDGSALRVDQALVD